MVQQLKNMECYLSLYPRGRKDGEGYISLYLYSTAKDMEVKPKFFLTIVSTEPSSDKSSFLENNAINKGLGYPKFMSLNDIYAKSRLYLPNDTLTLRCFVKPADDRPEETNGSESPPNFLRSSKSRTVIPVSRRSITLPVPVNKELGKRPDSTSFMFETAVTESAGFKITFHFTELPNEEFVKIEIRQTTSEEESFFVKCKMTVISAHKEYQDSEESTHYFESSLDDDIWHFPAFLVTSNLTRDKYLYLDDTLLLQCEFAFSCESTEQHSENNYMPLTFEMKDRSISEFFTNLEDLYVSGKFCDVELRAGDQTFPAHKVVLCAASSFFRAMFENDSKERDSGVVEIEDVDPDTLRRMLAFVHSDALKEDLSFEQASKLFSAANKYNLDTLRRRCAIVLVSSLSVANVCDVLVLADAHRDNFLLTVVHNFICSHTNETFSSDHWVRYMGLNPKLSGEIMHQMWSKKPLL